MHYYQIAFCGINIAELTYHSHVQIPIWRAVTAKIKNKSATGYIIKECEKPSFKTSPIDEILPLALTSPQALLATFIAKYYTCELGVTLGLFEPAFVDENGKILPQTPQSLAIQNLPQLNQSQTEALNFAIQNTNSLIFGDTGSGKSEIYISLIARALQEGKQALLLMPEISLTPQMQRRLERYFGKSVAIWHSKISPKRKAEILNGIADTSIRVLAGARSALFLPLEHLGFIAVDEEHDESYKNQSSRPHYNARDLAIWLGTKLGVRVLLGSATPSATSFAKQPSFRLKGTFFNSKKYFIYDESEPGLSQIIKNELANVLSNKKQAIICLPTRANFKYLQCQSCGEIVKCPFCSVGMSFYKRERVLKCQYCNYHTSVQSSCDKCGAEILEAKKIGTTELLEQLRAEFANATIAKFDRDEITTQNKLVKALKEFNDGKIDILVGTQMLSKGHDYHNVELAVIMGADDLLAHPDFRARERTLALAMQVAGRAGRAGAGRVVVQSKQREFFENFISDYDAFLQDELEARSGLYPPYSRLLRLIITHKNERIAQEKTGIALSKIEKIRAHFSELCLIGHGKCQVERIGDKFRYEILLRSPTPNALLVVAKNCVDECVDVDIDPLNFS